MQERVFVARHSPLPGPAVRCRYKKDAEADSNEDLCTQMILTYHGIRHGHPCITTHALLQLPKERVSSLPRQGKTGARFLCTHALPEVFRLIMDMEHKTVLTFATWRSEAAHPNSGAIRWLLCESSSHKAVHRLHISLACREHRGRIDCDSHCILKTLKFRERGVEHSAYRGVARYELTVDFNDLRRCRSINEVEMDNTLGSAHSKYQSMTRLGPHFLLSTHSKAQRRLSGVLRLLCPLVEVESTGLSPASCSTALSENTYRSA